MKRTMICTLAVVALAVLATAQMKRTKGNTQSPAHEISATIAGKKIAISYSSPSMRGRKIFGSGGIISGDPTYPVWRAGADDATMMHTDAPLDFHGLTVPAGTYTLWVDTSANPWQLIINKQTGQWGTEYNKAQDLGRVPMDVTKPHTPIETFVIELKPEGGNRGRLTMSWENVVASAPFTVK